MKLERFVNSRFGVGVALFLGQVLPPALGVRFSQAVGNWIGSRRKMAQVRAVRANQWVVSGESLTPEGLDQITRATFCSAARNLYDYFHYFRDPKAIEKLVQFSPGFERCLEQLRSGGQGILFVCPHLSNIDLIGRAAALHGLSMQILSYPQPPGSYRLQNLLRKMTGLDVTPMSYSALRQAAERLKAGGAVLTGVDRPLPDSKYKPRFFNRPAALPVAYVRLALKTGLPVTVLVGCRRPDDTYYVWASDPIPMQPHPDLETEVVRNAEAVLDVVTSYIREVPEQWAMFYPVWSEALNEIS
ncbi:MAG: hypothetical protein U1B80_05455 [Anaerolineaceae bacterium]|nr:hypothetical protein [Anaerolineaceae bacterium]